MSEQYQMLSENPESTVVATFEGGYYSAAQYQTEAAMEADFIDRLKKQAYEYVNITDEKQLIANLRTQLERLNGIRFSDREWDAFFKQYLGNPNDGIVEKTVSIQQDERKVLRRDDGSFANIILIDKRNIHNNKLQVINQYVPQGGAHDNRYDVTILVNGLPLVHVELKRRGVSVREAFNQIRRYNRESFWSGTGLFEFVQIFVISNGTLTKYYSNTTRNAHVKQQTKSSVKSKKQTSNSYEFTSYWANSRNEPIRDLMDFTQTFFAKHTLLNIITRYCVFTEDKLLLVMRPYQIAATEAILTKIVSSHGAGNCGKREGGGYIWHTTGSGKTLTSFKTAMLASKLEDVDKVLFVVDRKDLDYQTMKEYEKFQKGSADSSTSTAVLKQHLDKVEGDRVVITTIQKLSNFIAANPSHPVYGKRVVMIFDECHRSQFGAMHAAIVKRFKKYHMFGFTGTPIFPANATNIKNVNFTTTEGAFGDRLHSYTIIDAIRDGNVLPFRVDYIRTMRAADSIDEELVHGIDQESVMMAPTRIEYVTRYILEHFDQKTKRNAQHYDMRRTLNIGEVSASRHGAEEKKGVVKVKGFNSMFAVASIPFVKLYYNEFKRQMAQLPPDKRLKIATIYSYAPNEAQEDFEIDENNENTDNLDQSSRDFLESCIQDYNEMFGTSYDTSAEKFQNYYKDLSLRVKNREVDLLIVVNMFLTGFDAPTLNTLWVDKNLRMHGLLQAYSRTNRILNSIKTFGNIVCFRNLEPATNAALELFGNKDAGGMILLRTFDDYFNGYTDEGGERNPGYAEVVAELLQKFPADKPIVGEEAEKEFIRAWGNILRFRNILQSFDQFEEQDMLGDDRFKDYQGIYLDLYDKYRKTETGEAANILDDVVFEMELVKSVEINIDYILFLIGQLTGDPAANSEIIVKIKKSIGATPDLRNKEELIMRFIDNVNSDSSVDDQWSSFVSASVMNEVNALIDAENLKPEETFSFLVKSFANGEIRESGDEIPRILPAMSLFTIGGGSREVKRKRVTERLKELFNKFYDICGGVFPFLQPKSVNVLCHKPPQ